VGQAFNLHAEGLQAAGDLVAGALADNTKCTGGKDRRQRQECDG
jgi:hypothetical protein